MTLPSMSFAGFLSPTAFSGHVGGFSDPMVDCKETKLRYRADHLLVMIPNDRSTEKPWMAFVQGTDDNEKARRLNKLGYKFDQLEYGFWTKEFTKLLLEDHKNVIAPEAKHKGSLTEPRQFNLMFHTFVGATAGDENKAYLRPETAQGIFLNFKNVLDSSRVRVPFGIAQVGKAFRNEVTPRNFIFRSREFEQMEMEWFCHPKEAKMWRDFWFQERQKFWKGIGLSGANIQLRDHDKDELSHYAKEGYGTADIEYKFPFTAPGFGELEGIAHRCDFDLTQHEKFSGTKLTYMDPVTNEKFVPHVIEPAAGLSRGVLALICEAYTIDPSRPSGVYLNFHPSVAPLKAAILPLTAKEDHVPIARDLYLSLREEFAVELDIKQNIGKRYARQDEIGTPYCFTIDNDTLQDKTVTVRDRNTMSQERIPLASVAEYLRAKMKPGAAQQKLKAVG